MTALSDYEESINSQFGEDGIIDFIIGRLGLGRGLAVEVGAADGRECSNTLLLRDVHDWDRILIEADEERFNRIEEHERDLAINTAITHDGPQSLDALCYDREVTLLSLDIDGDDYRVLRDLLMRPPIIVAEFHPSIPWHLDITSPEFGSSLRALCRLMPDKGYTFLGATHCNAFFVADAHAHLFTDLDKSPQQYLKEENMTYVVSTMYGGAVAFGPKIFGLKHRFDGQVDVIEPDGSHHEVNLKERR